MTEHTHTPLGTVSLTLYFFFVLYLLTHISTPFFLLQRLIKIVFCFHNNAVKFLRRTREDPILTKPFFSNNDHGGSQLQKY